MKLTATAIVGALLGFGAVVAPAQSGLAIHFSNYFGPGRSLPFSYMGGNGPLMDAHWKAELLLGPYPDLLTSVGPAVTFWEPTPGNPTGLFMGGVIYPPLFQTYQGAVYAKVRVWGGADTFAAARYHVRGETAVFEIPRFGDDAGKLVNMVVPWVGPIQAGYDAMSTVTLPNRSVTLHADVFEFPWQPLHRNWQRQDPATLVWTNILSATNDSLTLTLQDTQDTGWFRLGTAVAPEEVLPCSSGCSGAAWVGIVSIEAGKILVKGPQGGRFQVFASELISPYPAWRPWLTNIVMGKDPFALPLPQGQPGVLFFRIEADYWQDAPELP